MTKITLADVVALRKKTKAGVMDCRKALEQSGGDMAKAQAWIREKGIQKAAKRVDREVAQGMIEAYSHADGKIVAVVELRCETDFVARNADFRNLAHEIALQVTSMNPKTVEELLEQSWIRDESRKIGDLVKETVGKFGENIVVAKIARFELGKK
ncbi:translation elongation factor Ts [Candidatus Shapirobacteria bacterium CG09_land_8_20_14_0_10_47_13]|uniref:Elongation factor Ts n=1 Tax=Candidatus Shapirobacteria bacterium CG09_land_8_20_14_0_10_47_13 TaxID=1974481 RepID=A0A2H0WNC8_9BACT|nr:MAG: translation elongation factor Ts [Candidatus Shapirobacteria bacterium CG09_land_8_20_14_0_10_47_13]